MRSGHFGIYKGKEHRIYFQADGTVDIVSENQAEISTGFQRSNDGRFIKNVKTAELDKAYAIDPKAEYRGQSVGIYKENGDQVLIFTDGEYDVMKELGFNYIERGVYEKWVKKDDLENFREEKTTLKI